MSFSVDIAKSVGGSRRRFDLHVAFETTARRTVIYGPSGAGKSLTLQAIAGLLPPDRGRILFGGETLFDREARVNVPARARRFGYLFQDYALFPGLNVRQNVAFGLSSGLRNPPKDAGGAAVEQWLDALELREVGTVRRRDVAVRGVEAFRAEGVGDEIGKDFWEGCHDGRGFSAAGGEREPGG